MRQTLNLGLLPYPLDPVRHATAAPNLLIHWLLVGGLMLALAVILGLLLRTLRVSRQTTQATLAELARVKASLEATVDQRTTELQQTAVLLADQLRYAEAVALCSRILLTPLDTAEAFQQAIARTLEVVRETVGGDRVSLARYAPHAEGEARMRRSYQQLVAAEHPGLPPLAPLTPAELADMPLELNVWRQGGGTFNGPVAGRFPTHPHYQHFCEANGIQSTFIHALTIGERWWGHITVIDHQQARSWSAGAVRMIQTVAEMLVPFTESWEVTQVFQERESLLRSITDALPDGYLYQVVQRRDGSYIGHTYLSGGVERLFGLTPPQVYADSAVLHAKIYREDWAQVDAVDLASARDLTLFEVESRAHKADGSVGWFQFRALPQLRPDGLVSWNGLCQEITARKQAELGLAAQLGYAEALARCSQILLVEGAEALVWEPVVQQAIATLRAAVGCARLALWLFPTPDTATPASATVIADQDPTRAPFQEVPVDDTEAPLALREAILRGEIVLGAIDDLFPTRSSIHTHFALNGLRSIMVAGVQLSGTWRGQLIAADAAASRQWDEPATRLLRTGLEMVTAFIHQVETAMALRAREAQLRAVGDNLPSGFIYQLRRDAGWNASFTYLSSGVAQTLGVSVEEGLRDAGAIYATILPEDQVRIAATEHISADTLLDFEATARLNHPSGRKRWVYLRSRPRHAEDGSVIWDGLTLDITERQRAAEQLERARDAAEAATRAKSAFLASMSHEIRTPLNAVLGMAALLQDTALTEEQQVCVDTIRTGGQALLGVISDILDFSRIESGHVELQMAPFDLPACLANTVELVAYDARRKGLAVTCTCDPGVPRVIVGDEARLRQVLLNLLSNAVKFTDQGEVTLHTTAVAQGEQAALVTLSVRDTGIGMAPEQQRQIFEPFVQADRAMAQRYGGAGLGLSICHQLTQMMGGTITVASSVGAGSTFSVSIPFPRTDAAPPPRPAEPVASRSRPLRVLVAEDSPLNQEVVRRMLLRLDHEVTVVGDGQAALDAVRRQAYDVVLMDAQMPVLDGEEATRQIRQLGPTVAQPRIIALTANALAGDRERFLRAGMDDYLSKPVLPADLQRALADVASVAEQHEDGAEAPQAAPAAQLISWTVIDQLLASHIHNSAEVAASILQLFEEDLEQQLGAIDAALGAGDMALLRAGAHRLRGGCLQLGAQALAVLCAELERADSQSEVEALAARLRPCYRETLAALRQHFAS